MATVYRARHKLVDRPCAVKIMNPGLRRDPVVRERFRREAKAAQKLAHPNIIEIFDQGDTDDGTSLHRDGAPRGRVARTDARRAGRLDVERALPIMIQIARALARAHDFEVIHRDLKPENIFLCRRGDGTDLVKLLDFGIARSMQDARLTGQGEVFGTPQYMAPERITSIDAGALVRSLRARRHLLRDAHRPAAVRRPRHPHLLLEAPEGAALRRSDSCAPDAPARLEELILSLMAKDPGARRSTRTACTTTCSRSAARARRRRCRPSPMPRSRSSRRRRPRFLRSPSIGWAKRTAVFEQMLARAYDGKPPGRACQDARGGQKARAHRGRAALRERHRAAQARGARVAWSRRSPALRLCGGRARHRRLQGARRSARGAHRSRPPSPKSGRGAGPACSRSHKEILMWEGRSAFEEPYKGLEEALRDGGRSGWRLARGAKKDEQKVREQAETRDREVADLEFQIHELRAALAKLEHNVEDEKTKSEKRIADLDTETEALQVELLALATRFCAPLAPPPRAGPLFQELEADAAALNGLVIAPNSLKGSLDAFEAAAAIAEGLARAVPGAELDQLPIADGGDLTAAVLVRALGGSMVSERSERSLRSQPIEPNGASWATGRRPWSKWRALRGSRCCGLGERNPMLATSYGAGSSSRQRSREGAGASSSGWAAARPSTEPRGSSRRSVCACSTTQGAPIPRGGGGLGASSIASTCRGGSSFGEAEIVVACDVDSELLGEPGAARMFGPQKGATPEMVEALEANLGSTRRRDRARSRARRSKGRPWRSRRRDGGRHRRPLGRQARAGHRSGARSAPFRRANRRVRSRRHLRRSSSIARRSATRAPTAWRAQRSATACRSWSSRAGSRTRRTSKDFEVFDAMFSVCARPMELREAIAKTRERMAATAEQVGQGLARGHRCEARFDLK